MRMGEVCILSFDETPFNKNSKKMYHKIQKDL